MVDTERFCYDPFLAEGVEEHFVNADPDVVEPVLGLAEPYQGEPAPKTVAEEEECRYQERGKEYGIGGHCNLTVIVGE
ncbi:hypothetical protein OR1_04195 [Geobacter sp. OR-1]|nr:hypothetical protein OR1_04195 [Geobacter sp. OR-1]